MIIVKTLEELEKLVSGISEKIEKGETSAEECVTTAKQCLKILLAVESEKPDLQQRYNLDDLEERFLRISKFQPAGTESEEDNLIYSRYCSIQILHAARELIDTLKEFHKKRIQQ